MKLSRFLLFTGLITLFLLLYVYQQTEIFQLAYAGQRYLNTYQDLLDKNTVLRYNISRNASLVRIGNKVDADTDYEMPDTYRLVKLQHPKEINLSRYAPNKENILSRIFSIKREAQAKTINP